MSNKILSNTKIYQEFKFIVKPFNTFFHERVWFILLFLTKYSRWLGAIFSYQFCDKIKYIETKHVEIVYPKYYTFRIHRITGWSGLNKVSSLYGNRSLNDEIIDYLWLDIILLINNNLLFMIHFPGIKQDLFNHAEIYYWIVTKAINVSCIFGFITM